MATPADDHSEKLLVYHEWLNVLGPLTSANVLDYFAACQLFWDPQCNNNILRMQSQHLGTSVNLDELKNMKGVEYAVVHAEPPTLFVIHKRERLSPTEGPINPSSHPALATNDDSVEDGDDTSSGNRLRGQPKRQVANVPGMMAALQTTKAHMEQQYQQRQKRAEKESAANVLGTSGTATGTRHASVAPMTPAPDAIPRVPETDTATGTGAAKVPAPKGQGKKKQKRLSMVAEKGAQ
ncbi:Mediator of RNA polymerase II transcription subunit 6 [Ceratobasidium theobromae]|uniref:Mediator of RNA polymerase II transcription subunit 6 n=1 Tax=Ceratobasidium theobromae TaxID=1582974 RepID=A0A5N5QP50_9AGAM|nr:Mediator of RNA polymerase II transcription subunit 6 [Ceratobasidium theobromae]